MWRPLHYFHQTFVSIRMWTYIPWVLLTRTHLTSNLNWPRKLHLEVLSSWSVDFRHLQMWRVPPLQPCSLNWCVLYMYHVLLLYVLLMCYVCFTYVLCMYYLWFCWKETLVPMQIVYFYTREYVLNKLVMCFGHIYYIDWFNWICR